MTMIEAHCLLELTNPHDEGGNGEEVEKEPADVMVLRARVKHVRHAAADE